MVLEMLNYVRQIIEENFGHNKIENIEYLSSGRINNVFKVTLKGCEQKEVVVRLRYFHDKCFGQRFGTEIMIDDILKKSVNYPDLLVCDSSRKTIPCEYSILTFAKGRNFNPELDGIEQFEKLGRIVKKIHAANVPEKYREQFISTDKINDYYTKRFEKIIEDSKKYDPHMYELIKDAMKYYYRDEYSPDDISLTHHDLHEKNIIVSGKNMTLLDWESARVEAREVEFIRAKYYLLNRAIKPKVVAFIKGYGKMQFSDNFFMQEVMWLARISNFERKFPPKKQEQQYWCSADYLASCLENLISNYKGRGTYTTFNEIITPTIGIRRENEPIRQIG